MYVATVSMFLSLNVEKMNYVQLHFNRMRIGEQLWVINCVNE